LFFYGYTRKIEGKELVEVASISSWPDPFPGILPGGKDMAKMTCGILFWGWRKLGWRILTGKNMPQRLEWKLVVMVTMQSSFPM
jgi:hypothetical protein